MAFNSSKTVRFSLSVSGHASSSAHRGAARNFREERYRNGEGASLEEADAMPVEGEIDRLRSEAAVLLDNSSTD